MELKRNNTKTTIHTLDLHFMGIPDTIGVYLIPYDQGAVLIECGPGSTIPTLVEGLEKHGHPVDSISDVFLTHIHLDHAGAAGWLAEKGARIHVHPIGAPHLLNPEKLLASAGRIYGEMMETLWGQFLPVPEDKLSVLHDGAEVEVSGLVFHAIETPGHASHHFAYLFEGFCFSGDIGGVRIPGPRHLRVPMPPPEFHLEMWRESLNRLKREEINSIAPTHFGIYDDPDWHLSKLLELLDEIEAWMEGVMPADPSVEEINEKFLEWTRERSLQEGLQPELMSAYEAANPSWMSAHGMQRYWKKYRK
jgi:glyoxylase-like metal-dependent hydrolase (beta-lactamase superfamily II)